MENAANIRALMIEKANLVKQHLAEFDKQAGPDDAAFRKAVLAFYKPYEPFTVEIVNKK